MLKSPTISKYNEVTQNFICNQTAERLLNISYVQFSIKINCNLRLLLTKYAKTIFATQRTTNYTQKMRPNA